MLLFLKAIDDTTWIISDTLVSLNGWQLPTSTCLGQNLKNHFWLLTSPRILHLNPLGRAVNSTFRVLIPTNVPPLTSLAILEWGTDVVHHSLWSTCLAMVPFQSSSQPLKMSQITSLSCSNSTRAAPHSEQKPRSWQWPARPTLCASLSSPCLLPHSPHSLPPLCSSHSPLLHPLLFWAHSCLQVLAVAFPGY